MTKYVIVEKDSCIACAACNSAASDIFDLDNDGLAEVIYEGDNNRGITLIAQELLDDLEEAMDSCPSCSIKLAAVPFA